MELTPFIFLLLLTLYLGFAYVKENHVPLPKLFSASIRNDAGERIATLDFTVPVLHAGILFYKQGELQSANPEISGRDIRLWYPPEEVSAKPFLESVRKASVVVGTHEKSTNENNVATDGFPLKVWYDESKKAAMIDGVVKGANNAEQIRYLKDSAGFGSSGFIDARQIEIKQGTTPDNEPFDAIARDLFCTHVALLANVRDPKNKIVTKNAMGLVFNAGTLKPNTENDFTNSEDNTGGGARSINTGGKMAEDKKDDGNDLKNQIRNVLDEMKKEDASSAKMAELEKTVNALNEKLTAADAAKNGAGKNAEEKKDEPAKAENADGEKDGETLNAKNAKPTQENVKLIGEHFGIDFGRSTPTFNALAPLVGAEGKTFPEIVSIVNAKATEIKNAKPAEGAAVLNAPTPGGFDAYTATVKVGN